MRVQFDAGDEREDVFDRIYWFRKLQSKHADGTALSDYERKRLATLEISLRSLGTDPRRFERVETPLAAVFHDGIRWHVTYLADISAGGVAASMPSSVRADKALRLLLPNANAVYEFEGQIAWERDSLMGIEFVGVPRRLRPKWMHEKPMAAELQAKPRVEASLSVRLGDDFAAQFAEHISRGGLFVPAADGLAVGQPLEVAVDLPGHGSFSLTAKVDRLGTEGRGVDLSIINSPPDFSCQISSYLKRLHLRHHFTVLSTIPSLRSDLERVGYHVATAPSAPRLDDVILEHRGAVAGVVVEASQFEQYATLAKRLGYIDLVIVAPLVGDFDAVLQRIDANIAM